MKFRLMAHDVARFVMIPVLSTAVGVALAQGPPPGPGPQHDDHHNDAHYGDHDHDRGDNFHFRDQDRGPLESHYRRDIDRWHYRPGDRPHFIRGQHIPDQYRFQPVPRAYYRDMPPPPAGYQYGYYQGYVVAYNPTSRIIADVIDLFAAASSH